MHAGVEALVAKFVPQPSGHSLENVPSLKFIRHRQGPAHTVQERGQGSVCTTKEILH